ncbi:MAG: D-alanine--D-alanine ligase [Holosporaceae bacterium]|jgi:D-alanine-D-alanine ligase|nr:D-alanine--D-alanine ligase [Holosporaceae bacterium]
MRKIRVGVFFGGRSSEHEVSLISAKNIVENLDRSKYDVILIGADREGNFHFGKKEISSGDFCKKLSISEKYDLPEKKSADLPKKMDERLSDVIDVAFPVFHGQFGEDGTIQGLLRAFNVPFVGSGILGSAIGMDKDVTKRLLRDANIPSPKHLSFYRHRPPDAADYDKVVAVLGEVVFVKPASLGSSVGISKTKSKDEFEKAVEEAFRYDNKIIVEEFIKGREIECSVLGNEYPEASVPGEILLKKHEFYSYRAKYLDDDGAELKIPADLSTEVVDKIKQTAIRAFEVLCCEGMARIDFFVKNDTEVFLNEINTIPGFTKISMYPKLWEASGVPYGELLDRLITLATERHRRDGKLSVAFCAEAGSPAEIS